MNHSDDLIRLFSGSPLRHQLVVQLGLPCVAVPVDADEAPDPAQPPEQAMEQIARRKLHRGLQAHLNAPPAWGMAADTLLITDHGLLGKPSGLQEATRFLEHLSGRVHKVGTAVALATPQGIQLSKTAITQVQFRHLTPEDIQWYLSLEEWVDAAGGYRIQNAGETLVESIEGHWSTVAGLPLPLVYGMLRELSYPFGSVQTITSPPCAGR